MIAFANLQLIGIHMHAHMSMKNLALPKHLAEVLISFWLTKTFRNNITNGLENKGQCWKWEWLLLTTDNVRISRFFMLQQIPTC